MNRRKKVVIGFATALVVLLAAALAAVMKMGQAHERWHTCRENCWLLDDAKRICAEESGLTNGIIVPWEDIQPFLTNSVYWASLALSPSGLPKCPEGGTYMLNPIGTWSTCSVPYHQWNNCKSKGGTLWRE